MWHNFLSGANPVLKLKLRTRYVFRRRRFPFSRRLYCHDLSAGCNRFFLLPPLFRPFRPLSRIMRGRFCFGATHIRAVALRVLKWWALTLRPFICTRHSDVREMLVRNIYTVYVHRFSLNERTPCGAILIMRIDMREQHEIRCFLCKFPRSKSADRLDVSSALITPFQMIH